jgi:hypothetical protein
VGHLCTNERCRVDACGVSGCSSNAHGPCRALTERLWALRRARAAESAAEQPSSRRGLECSSADGKPAPLAVTLAGSRSLVGQLRHFINVHSAASCVRSAGGAAGSRNLQPWGRSARALPAAFRALLSSCTAPLQHHSCPSSPQLQCSAAQPPGQLPLHPRSQPPPASSSPRLPAPAEPRRPSGRPPQHLDILS